ncbi:MAG TPA: PQQ-dependent dehydrogenase, methanol/ethanol family [Steroidobacteraceae bacterium]|nr:PQQ-dependent dehydrogenase, methanol/ethanol family [Steroidobacteraceae bacterium]
MDATRSFAGCAALALLSWLPACSKQAPPAPAAGQVDAARIAAAENNAEWLTVGRTYSEQHYSPLAQINRDNVKTLGLAWYYQFDANTDRGMEATPVVVDGTLYVSTSWSKVAAFDARTGALKWLYDPQVDGQKAREACCDVVNRGVAVWQGKVYVGALDGRLIALDAGTGKPVWSVQTTDPAWPYTITGAPRVAKGKVFIGNGGSELGVRGYVSAYDAGTGALSWRFYVTPNPYNEPDNAVSDKPLAELARKTWSGKGWKQTGGGGASFDALVYDPVTDLLYIGTGNGSPWSYQARSDSKGDNLFLSSIVAVKADTGEYVWHYQETPGDSWDYTATQPIMTADLTIDGARHHVLMQAPKNGFFYVLDAATGKLLAADKYAAVNWAEKVDPATGRPSIDPRARYANGKPTELSVGPNGGHIWQPMAFDPQEALVYIPVHRESFSYQNDPRWQFVQGRWNLAQGPLAGFNQPRPPPPPFKLSAAGEAALAKLPAAGGFLVAWDPVARQARWTVPQGTVWNGGVVATAGGLVFGGADATFNAYDAKSGQTLWTDRTAAAVMAGPATYEIDGEQYIAVTVGYGGANAMIGGRFPRRPDRLYVYKLGGTVKAPDFAPFEPLAPLDFTRVTGSRGNVKRGGELVGQWCLSCHIGGVYTPDLTRSPALYTWKGFADIVHDGALKSRGMAGFAKWLNFDDVEDIRAYWLDQAKQAQAAAK